MRTQIQRKLTQGQETWQRTTDYALKDTDWKVLQ